MKRICLFCCLVWASYARAQQVETDSIAFVSGHIASVWIDNYVYDHDQKVGLIYRIANQPEKKPIECSYEEVTAYYRVGHGWFDVQAYDTTFEQKAENIVFTADVNAIQGLYPKGKVEVKADNPSRALFLASKKAKQLGAHIVLVNLDPTYIDRSNKPLRKDPAEPGNSKKVPLGSGFYDSWEFVTEPRTTNNDYAARRLKKFSRFKLKGVAYGYSK